MSPPRESSRSSTNHLERIISSLVSLICLALTFLVSTVNTTARGVHLREIPWNSQLVDTVDNARQQESGLPLLEPGKKIDRQLAGGETHSYSLTLAKDQFCHVVVDQRGIDVVVAFYRPDGTKIAEVDSPNYKLGQEPLSLIAETPGAYRLEIV